MRKASAARLASCVLCSRRMTTNIWRVVLVLSLGWFGGCATAVARDGVPDCGASDAARDPDLGSSLNGPIDPGGAADPDLAPASTADQVPLAFAVVDAEFSRALNRLVLLGGADVVLLDPDTGARSTIVLPLAGTAISIAPDGLTAVVGHDGYLSLVELATATLLKTVAVACPVGDVVLSGDGVAYAFPSSDQWVDIFAVRLSDGAALGDGSHWTIYAGSIARLHPNGDWIYTVDPHLSPVDLEKFDVAGGIEAKALYDSPYHGDHPIGGNLWFTETGDRIFTAAGSVFRTSAVEAQDMLYAGSLFASTAGDVGLNLAWIDHHAATQRVAAIRTASSYWGDTPPPNSHDTSVVIYEDEYLQPQKTLPLGTLLGAPSAVALHGRFVFFRADGAELFVVASVEGPGSVASVVVRLVP